MELDLLSQLEMAARQGNVIIMGDFNYLYIDRAEGIAHSLKARPFLNVPQDNFMSKLVDSPTSSNTFLDLLITKDADVEIWDNLGTSNHRIITFGINRRKERHEGSTRTLNFKSQLLNCAQCCRILIGTKSLKH